MQLKRVVIKNFRCFDNEGIDVKLNKTTVIIGENNCGKTSFLDAIKIALSKKILRNKDIFHSYDYHISNNSEIYPENPIEITLYFSSDKTIDKIDERLVQSLGNIINNDINDKPIITLQVKSEYNKVIKDYDSIVMFLDHEENELTNIKRNTFYDFLDYFQYYYLYSLRDSSNEFSNRSSFWSSFVKNPDITEEEVTKLQKDLEELNEQVIGSNKLLDELVKYLNKTKSVISHNNSHDVNISAIPGRLNDLFSKAQLNYSTSTGLNIPLERHGSGTQSLSVIFLFEAYINIILNNEKIENIYPIFSLEEPEAHLHPSAIKSLWNILKNNTTQQLISTHSGDLLSNLSLENILKFKNEDSGIKKFHFNKGNYSEEEIRKIKYHIQSYKGFLFFSKVWILVEGETEYWALTKLSEKLNLELNTLGIDIIKYADLGINELLKLSIDFGIKVVVLTDNDQQGISDYNKAVNLITDSTFIFKQNEKNIELYFCYNGFGKIYQNHISDQKRDIITIEENQMGYWEQVIQAQDKESKVLKCIDIFNIEENDKIIQGMSFLITIIEKAKELA